MNLIAIKRSRVTVTLHGGTEYCAALFQSPLGSAAESSRTSDSRHCLAEWPSIPSVITQHEATQ